MGGGSTRTEHVRAMKPPAPLKVLEHRGTGNWAGLSGEGRVWRVSLFISQRVEYQCSWKDGRCAGLCPWAGEPGQDLMPRWEAGPRDRERGAGSCWSVLVGFLLLTSVFSAS